MSYYNPPPSYGGGSFPPPFPPQQSPPNMNYNAYSPPTAAYDHQQQQQYSPTGQSMYGLEPTTPVLDQNQMNYFWNEVRSGNIPTIPSAQQHTQPFAPPPLPPQSYAPQYQYPQYGNQSQTSPAQESFHPPPHAHYHVSQDVPMAEVNRDDGELSDDEGEEYSPPDIATHSGLNGTGYGLPGLGQISHGKKPADSTHEPNAYQPPPFNPFKSLSHYEPPPPTPPVETRPPAKAPAAKQSSRQIVALRDKAVDVVKDFHAHGIGYSQLAQEPSFDGFDKDLLRQLYAQYNIPQELEPIAATVAQEHTVADAEEDERITELKRVLGVAGYVLDDATLASLAGSRPQPASAHAPASVPAPQQEATAIPGLVQQEIAPSAAPPTRPLSTNTAGADGTASKEGRNAYLAKLKAMKGKGAASQQSTQVKGASQASLPGLGASTPRRIIINRDALQRKLQAQREAQARAAKELVDPSTRPAMPLRTESMSSINYDSAQVSAQSGSDAEPTAAMDMSSPEEGEDLEEGEEDEEPGEVLETPPEQPTTIQPASSIPGLPPKPPESRQPTHARNESDQSAKGSPHAGLPARPPVTRQPYPYPPAVPSPGAHARPWQPDPHLKRPASSAFGSPWDPRAKRQYPPAPIHDVPEPVVIDISSEEEGEMSEDEMDDGPDAPTEHSLPKKPEVYASTSSNQQPRTPWKPQPQSGLSSAYATPPAMTTPDPIHAARLEEQAKQKALLEAKKEALKRKIQMKEAQKKQVATGAASPAVVAAAAALSSPAGRDGTSVGLPAIRASSVASRGLPSRITSSPRPVLQQGRSSSVARQVALKSLEADIKSDEEQMEALQAQMERLRQEVARKNAEKAALFEEIKSFGVDPQGLSHAQMQSVRDKLVEEAAGLDPRDNMVVDDQENDAEDEEEDSESEEGEEDEEEGELAAEKDGEAFSDLAEANDPRAVESGSRIQIHNVLFTLSKRNIRQFLSGYDLTGISLPLHGSAHVKGKKKAGYAFVDFLYPAEAQQAIDELSGSALGGASVRLQLVKPVAAGTPKHDLKTSRLIIRDLPPSLRSEKGLQSYLQKSGVLNIMLPRDQHTNKSADYAILEFGTAANAERALAALRQRKIAKKPLNVGFDTPETSAVPALGSPLQLQHYSSVAAPVLGVGVPLSHHPTVVEQGEDEEGEHDEEEDDEEEGEEESNSEEEEEGEEGEEESDDDAMSVSEDGSEDGEVNSGHVIGELQPPQSVSQQPVLVEEDSEDGEEDSDDMDESESEDEEADVAMAADAGVSLKDVEDVPMDEDGVSDEEASESEAEPELQPSDDDDDEEEEEEGEVENEIPVDQTMLQLDFEESESEEEASDEVEVAEDDFVPPPGPILSEVQREQTDPIVGAFTQAANSVQTNELVGEDAAMTGSAIPEQASIPTVNQSVQDDAPMEPKGGTNESTSLEVPASEPPPLDLPSHSTHIETEIVDETVMIDDNDDDFYEPEDEAGGAAGAPPPNASVDQDEEEDEYDPDFDAAFEEAFAEIDEEAAKAGSNAGELSQVSAAASVNGTSADSVQQLQQNQQPEEEEGAQPDRSSGIPGLGMQNGDGAADAMELSEEGEIVSESGDAVVDTAAASADSARVSSSFVPAAYADHRFGDADAAFPSQRHPPGRPSSPPVNFPIPKWRPLGTLPRPSGESKSTDTSTDPTTTTSAVTQFTPYQSALKSLKAYRYHPNYVTDVAGGIKSLSYSHKINPQLPLCPTELDGGTCTDPQCPGQHFKDMKLADQDIIRFLGTFDKPTPSKEEKNRWADGLRLLIEGIRKEGINDVDQIANRVAAYRRAFFGNSILDFDAASKEEEEDAHPAVRDSVEELSEGEMEE